MSEPNVEEPAGEGEIKRWEIPAIDGSSENGFLTAAGLQELQKQAWDEAYEVGHAEGLKAGQDEVDNRAARFDQLLIALAKPFDQLDGSVEKQLVELAMTVAKQLFRREIQIDSTHIIGVVRDAIKMLPVASRSVEAHLHPDDAELVREALPATANERAWAIVEDPLISRGGCRITTEDSQVDAQAETRLNAIINAVCGDERQP